MTDIIKAITVRQPWAEAIVAGHKTIENRGAGFPKKHRGELLIHSAAGWSARGQTDPRIRSIWANLPHDASDHYQALLRHTTPTGGRPIHPFRGGVILGIVEVIDIHPDCGCCRPWGESEYVASDGNLKAGVTHLVLENARRFDPVPARGALGLWAPNQDALAAVALARETEG